MQVYIATITGMLDVQLHYNPLDHIWIINEVKPLQYAG